MTAPVIRIEHISKQYRLGVISSSTLRDDVQRWWYRMRGLPDPLARIDFHAPAGTSASAEAKPRSDLWALSDVSFEVKRGEVLGIIGKNGAGKSTLLKLLSRVTAPTSGRICARGRIASLLEVGTGFHPDLTGRENIFLNGAILGLTRAEIRERLDEIVAFSGVERFVDTPVKRYSSGMYVRLAFSVAAHLEPEILIVDEVLAVGDVEFQSKCFDKLGSLANSGRTVILVSHNMPAVRNLCSRGILLEAGRCVLDDNVQNCIAHYLSQHHKAGSVVEFPGAPLHRVEVIQDDTRLLVTGSYNQDPPLKIPNFGFVVSSLYGDPIFGANPIVSMATPPSTPSVKGQVTALVQSPRLKAGRYLLSVWFGDAYTNIFHRENCLEFVVQNTLNVRQQAANSTVGSIEPQCQWTFNPPA